MRNYTADAVDTSLMEAARVDGAGELRTFAQIAVKIPGPVW
jgi:multiple sugar transport system permease protein